jgi:DNA-directed RNA polymerase specialized sigma24 family protein
VTPHTVLMVQAVDTVGRSVSPGTLGEVLFKHCDTRIASEDEWCGLLRDVAGGDIAALHGLYERASRLVYALAYRIVGSQPAAEEVTADVFEDVWRRAWAYNAGEVTVLAWIMNQTRTRARERAGSARSSSDAAAKAPLGDLHPNGSLADHLALRIANRVRTEPTPPPPSHWKEPEWREVAPRIECKLLASDRERERVGMLVRLAPGGEYPAHTHAGLEELHLIEGELWIDDRKYVPGDYYRAEAHSSDGSVRSATGCTCVLITSTADILH